VPDEVIAAIRRRERNGAIDLPKKRGLKTGDRVRIVSGLFAGRSALCAGVSREHIAVLLYMLRAQRQVRLRDDAVEPA
jgi:transcription antitermination factor NusG